MNIINWNISCFKDSTSKIEYLKTKLTKNSIAILEEVTPKSYKLLKTLIDPSFTIKYSLIYRKLGTYDTQQRELGIAIITGKDIKVTKTQVLKRALLPERTLLVDSIYKGKNIRVMGLHSITGCGYKKSKSLQFFSFAEALDKYKPDIVGIDANEPDIDHYYIEDMTFFDDNGKGSRFFFNHLKEFGLKDSYASLYNKSKFKRGKPLITSHIISKKYHKRYDFIFTNLKVKKCDYLYKKSIKAGSDHALIECII